MGPVRPDHLQVRMHHTGPTGIKIVAADFGIFHPACLMSAAKIKTRQFESIREEFRLKLIEFEIMLPRQADDGREFLMGEEIREKGSLSSYLPTLPKKGNRKFGSGSGHFLRTEKTFPSGLFYEFF
jgi:hypothetical protein